MDENLIKANCIHPIQINCFILCQFYAIVHTVVCKNESLCIYKKYTNVCINKFDLQRLFLCILVQAAPM